MKHYFRFVDSLERVFKPLVSITVCAALACIVSGLANTAMLEGKISQATCYAWHNVLYIFLFVSIVVSFIVFRPK